MVWVIPDTSPSLCSDDDRAPVGDANGSIPMVQPIRGRPMFGARAGAAAINSVLFVSQLSLDSGMIPCLPLLRSEHSNLKAQYHPMELKSRPWPSEAVATFAKKI